MDLAYGSESSWSHRGSKSEQTRLMMEQIDEVVHSVQGICSELRPPVLGHFGLTAAIGWYLGDFEKRTSIRCRARMDTRLPPLDKDLGILLFRIFQEAMTNVLRHAAQRRCRSG